MVSAARTDVAVARPVNLFSSPSLLDVDLEIAGPFGELVAALKPGHAASAPPESVVKLPGRISYRSADGARVTLAIELKARGHTSLKKDECAFPKWSVRLVAGQNAAGTLFEGIERLGVGSHCGETAGGRSPLGRTQNQKSPVREAAAYQVVSALGAVTLQARASMVRYVDTSAGGGVGTITRAALLLEDKAQAVTRLGGREIAPEDFSDALGAMDADATVRAMFAEALLGNYDFNLRMVPGDAYRDNARVPLSNVLAVSRPSGGAVPLVYDFDLAEVVGGPFKLLARVYGGAFDADPARLSIQGQLQRARLHYPREIVERVRRELLERQGEAFAVLTRFEAEWAARVPDVEGRAAFRSRLRTFFSVLEDGRSFELPTVNAKGAVAYTDPRLARASCAAGVEIPQGTPVRVLKRQTRGQGDGRGDSAEVLLLDIQWAFRAAQCPNALGPVWVDQRVLD